MRNENHAKLHSPNVKTCCRMLSASAGMTAENDGVWQTAGNGRTQSYRD